MIKFGAKCRFHDISSVDIGEKISSYEFHFTDVDVISGKMDGYFDAEYSIHFPEYWDGDILDIAGKPEKNLDYLLRSIDKGLELKKHFNQNTPVKFILHPGGMSIDPMDKNKVLELKNNFLQVVDKLSKNKDIEVLAENMPPLPWFWGGQWYSNLLVSATDMEEYCSVTGNRICFDTSHGILACNYNKINILDFIKLIKHYIAHIHLADGKDTAGEGIQIGTGDSNYKEILKSLLDIDCAFVPEILWGHKDGYIGFKTATSVIKSMMEVI